ncbi:FIST signal transduction protein [Ampullimonas aquatilis]|uniref:FIST signal transduction protein n=1 Tax=Ampullimonas aquatilis TaxID=1341549 RepID=UPI003C7585D4
MLFRFGHAMHPDWAAAVELCLAQIEGQVQLSGYGQGGNLGFMYFTDYLSSHVEPMLALLKQRTGIEHWVGGVGMGIAANGAEYFDEPALAILIGDFPADSFRTFSELTPLNETLQPIAAVTPQISEGPAADFIRNLFNQPADTTVRIDDFSPYTALVHASPSQPRLPIILQSLADQVQSRYLFGGLVSARGPSLHIADEVLSQGFSGVAFDEQVKLVSRVTQGCQPIARSHTITACDGNRVIELDGRPALDRLITDMGLPSRDGNSPISESTTDALSRVSRGLFCAIGLPDAQALLPAHHNSPGEFGSDFLVRHILGIDAKDRTVVIADNVAVGCQLAFCVRDTNATRADLIRICAELREEIEPEAFLSEAVTGAPEALSGLHPGRGIKGAIYISCIARGGGSLGEGNPSGPSAELKLIAQQLGEVPLIGLFANSEIAFDRLYSYSGVLTLFV